MPTGAISGIAVLDLDVKKGKDGLAFVPDWETRSPVIARTQRGGAHVYFKADGAPHCTSDDIALGVDTRGDGGYVIVPPSAGYSWINGSDFSKLPPWPDDLRPKQKTRNRNKPDAPLTDHGPLAAAIKAMPNNDLGWDESNKTGMALWRATDGNDNGKSLWHTYSAKSKKYAADETEARWEHYATSPPTELGAGTLFYLADQDVPGWRAAYSKQHFECKDDGRPISQSQRNITTALALLAVSLRHDVFSDRKTIVGLPGHDLLDDAAIERLWLLVDERFRFLPTKDFFWTVVSDAARRNAYHPVRIISTV